MIRISLREEDAMKLLMRFMKLTPFTCFAPNQIGVLEAAIEWM